MKNLKTAIVTGIGREIDRETAPPLAEKGLVYMDLTEPSTVKKRTNVVCML